MRNPFRRRPSGKINLISVFLLLLVAGTIYGIWKFGPPWWNSKEARNVLQETVYQAVRAHRHRLSAVELQEVREVLKKRFEAELGIILYDSDISFEETSDPRELTIYVDYEVEVVHPLIKRTTVVPFSLSATAP